MSIISTSHSIIAYQGTKHQPLTGQRLAVLTYKGRTIYTSPDGQQTYDDPRGKGGSKKPLPEGWTQEQQAAYPALAVSLPQVASWPELSSMPGPFRAMVAGLLEQVQDEVIAQMVNERRSSKPQEASINRLLSVSDSDINLDAIIQWRTAEASGRLSGERIGEWYDSILAEPLLAGIISKNPGMSDDAAAAVLSSYRAACMKLAAPEAQRFAVLDAGNIQQLRKALAYAPEGDQFASTLISRLEPTSKKAEGITLTAII